MQPATKQILRQKEYLSALISCQKVERFHPYFQIHGSLSWKGPIRIIKSNPKEMTHLGTEPTTLAISPPCSNPSSFRKHFYPFTISEMDISKLYLHFLTCKHFRIIETASLHESAEAGCGNCVVKIKKYRASQLASNWIFQSKILPKL